MHAASTRATWKQTLQMAAVVVVGYGLGVLAWRAFMVPQFSPLRLGEPDLVRPVELWRPNQHGLVFRYRDFRQDSVVLAGDSRVQRGIVLEEFRDAGFDSAVALTRPAAQTLDLLKIIDEQLPGRAVIALSPLGLLNEVEAPMPEAPKLAPWPRRLDAFTSDWVDMFRRRLAEPVLPPAWRFGWNGGFGQEKFFDAFRTSLRPETREARLAKLAEVEAFLAAMKAKGWPIVCVRIPTYGPMRAIEDEAFDPNLFTDMCARLEIPYWDYGVVEGETSDGSHLGVGGARRFSGQLAEDLKAVPGFQP